MFSKFINKSETFQNNMSVSKNHNDTTTSKHIPDARPAVVFIVIEKSRRRYYTFYSEFGRKFNLEQF